jgi:MoaA/NifB/PqqE/SkfB family radical SAM enzyme
VAGPERSARLELVTGDVLAQRFATPGWAAQARRVGLAEVRAAIDALVGAPPRALVLAAARPIDHPDLDAIVAHARARLPDAALTLECDGTWIDDAAIDRVRALGVTGLRIIVGGMRERVSDAVMRAPGTWRRAAQGLAAALAAPLELEIAVPALRWNRDDLVPLVDWLAALPGARPRLRLIVPRVAETGAAGRAALLRHDAVAALAGQVFDQCKRAGLGHGFAGGEAPAPCAAAGALDRFGAVFHDSLRRQAHEPERALVRIAACAECSLRHACRGLEPAYVAAFGEAGCAPVPLARSTSWRLRPTGHAHEVDYKQISPFDNDHAGHGRTLLRINGHCQMACAFCFVDRSAGDLPLATLTGELDRLAARHVDHVVLSGGEPTLHPELPAIIAHARALGYRTIEIQTNGVRCADRAHAAALVAAGLTKATVSLHSMDPALSDEITRMPRAFGQTIAGLHNLQALGVETQLAHVITRQNYQALPAFTRAVLDEFAGGARHLSICFAIAQGISDLVYAWVLPTFTEIKPYMHAALTLCRARGVGFGGLIGQGGYPPCQLDGEMAYYAGVLDKIYRSPDFGAQFHKAAACASCDFDRYCIGVRKDYVRSYGDDELRPIRIDPALLAGATPLPTTAAAEGPLIALGRRGRG